MKVFLIIFALCVSGSHAIPKPEPMRGRVGNGVIAENAPHACMVLVHRRSLIGTNTVVLGGGSIISTRHVVTAAHLVQGNNINYQIGFIVGTGRRLFTTTFRVIHEDYNNTSFDSDVALIFLQGTNLFPLASAITISTAIAVPVGGVIATMVGFGFTSTTSKGASSDPYAALQTVTNEAACVFDNFEKARTHFCALDTATTVVCLGDNGAGLFTVAAGVNTLVGIASRILTGCSTPQNTAFTNVGEFGDWISNIAGLSIAELSTRFNKSM